MTKKKYDYAWRKDGPMTFIKVLREAMEACSPELYQRWIAAKELLDSMYWYGVLHAVIDFKLGDLAWEYARLVRVVNQALVRAYLKERRAGVKPRMPGVPDGTYALKNEAEDAVRRYAHTERQRKLKAVNHDLVKATLGGIMGCCKSIAASENIKDVTSDDARELEAIYGRLAKIQARCANLA